MAAGSLATLGAAFIIGALIYAWDTEGALQSEDRSLVRAALIWLSVSIPAVAAACWLYRFTLLNKAADTTFKLTPARNARTEKLVTRASILVAIVYVAAKMVAAIGGAALSSVLQMIGWLMVGFVALHVRILIHELSHLFTAGAVRFTLERIQVGVGPVLWRRSFGIGLLAEWRLWPNGGFVSARPRVYKRLRLRQFVFVAAGPVADLLLLVGLFCLIKAAFGSVFAAFGAGAGGVLLGFIFWCLIASSGAGLFPHTFTMEDKTVSSDGYLLLQLCTRSAGYMPALNVGYDPKEALKLVLNASAHREAPDPPAGGAACENAFHAKVTELQQLRARLASPLLPRRRGRESRRTS